MHKVTIGIPTYNRSGLLEKALESIHKQTIKDFCVIVSDNCSDEEHQKRNKELVAIYEEKFDISYILHSQNIGAAKNFWSLIEKAETEYFCFLADDDYFAPTYLEACLHKFSELSENYVAVGGEAQYFWRDKSPELYDFFPEGVEFYEIPKMTSIERGVYQIQRLYGDMFYSLYKTHVLKTKSVEILFKNSEYSAEYPLCIAIALLGNRIILKDILLYKHTPECAVKWAKWQALGGFIGFLNLRALRNETRTVLRYRKDIVLVVDMLPISKKDKAKIMFAYTKYSVKHVLTSFIGYKNAKS